VARIEGINPADLIRQFTTIQMQPLDVPAVPAIAPAAGGVDDRPDG